MLSPRSRHRELRAGALPQHRFWPSREKDASTDTGKGARTPSAMAAIASKRQHDGCGTGDGAPARAGNTSFDHRCVARQRQAELGNGEAVVIRRIGSSASTPCASAAAITSTMRCGASGAGHGTRSARRAPISISRGTLVSGRTSEKSRSERSPAFGPASESQGTRGDRFAQSGRSSTPDAPEQMRPLLPRRFRRRAPQPALPTAEMSACQSCA